MAWRASGQSLKIPEDNIIYFLERAEGRCKLGVCFREKNIENLHIWLSLDNLHIKK